MRTNESKETRQKCTSRPTMPLIYKMVKLIELHRQEC